MVPPMNSLTVRPTDILAMNMPTKGHQAPVEDGPAVHPARRPVRGGDALGKDLTPITCSITWTQLLKRITVEFKLQNILEVETHRLHIEVEQEDGVVHEEDNEHEGEATAETEL